MDVLFLPPIFNLAAAVVCLIGAVKMHFVSSEKGDNVNIRYYFYSFVFITLYLLASGLPILLVEDSYIVFVLTALFRPFLLLGGMFLSLIALNLLKAGKLSDFYIFGVLFTILLSSVLTFLGIRGIGRATLASLTEAGYWIRPDSELITYGMISIGIVFVTSLFFSSVYYFWFAVTRRKHEVPFGKALMMGMSCTFFSFAAIANYILGANPDNYFLASLIASLMFIMGAVTLIGGVTYKGEKKKESIQYKVS